MNAVNWYIENRETYVKLCKKVENIIIELVELNKIPIHLIQSRAKEIDSLKGKLERKFYAQPKDEIHDYAGIRIIAYVEDDVQTISNLIKSNFIIDEDNSSDKSEDLGVNKVGYKSIHFVASLNDTRLQLPENQIFKNKCFEIQVRTILQHTWAEIEHDRSYKFSGVLPSRIDRKLKLLAGNLELVDMEFNVLARELDQMVTDIHEDTLDGNYDIELNSTSLIEYLQIKFQSIFDSKRVYELRSDDLIRDLKKFGVSTLKDLDNIIPPNFTQDFKDLIGEKQRSKWSVRGVLNLLMIIHDEKKYFDLVNSATHWTNHDHGKELYDKYEINWKKIKKEYDFDFLGSN